MSTAEGVAADPMHVPDPMRVDPMRVAVLMGGSSEERGVSLASGCEVAAALRSAGHHVTAIDSATGAISPEQERRILASGIGRDFHAPAGPDTQPRPGGGTVLPDAKVIGSEPALKEADAVFLALHGGAGEDGTIQTLLQAAGAPYAGSGPVGCALAMDKDLTKRLLRDEGIATPDWVVGAVPESTGQPSASSVVDRLGLPLIVKPVSGGSSMRLTLAKSVEEVAAAAAVAGGGGDAVMYEAYVKGREYTVGVLEDEALPVIEIEPRNELFDFDCKYVEGMARETVPAPIPETQAAALQSAALVVHRLLRLEHFSRTDFMVDADGTIWCLEANALPGLTRNSLVPKAARAAAIDFASFCERVCLLGKRRGSVAGRASPGRQCS